MEEIFNETHFNDPMRTGRGYGCGCPCFGGILVLDTATNKYVTGYVVTANYTGEVSKTTSDAVVYTAIFSGEEIPEEISESEIEQPATTLNFDSLKYPLIIAGSVMTLTSVGVFAFQKINKRRLCP
jgi:hypothetical protein